MFSGIVETTGSIQRVGPSEQGVEVWIHTGALDLNDVKVGDSLAVNGVCLTLTEIQWEAVKVFVSNETVSRTQFSTYRHGSPVNLEKPLTLSQGIGGHFVAGHIDAIGDCVGLARDGASVCLRIKIPKKLGPYVAEKGSITIDGVSLTVNTVLDRSKSTEFTVNVIPHTMQVTTLGQISLNDRLNVEVDLIARYIDRLSNFRKNEHVDG